MQFKIDKTMITEVKMVAASWKKSSYYLKGGIKEACCRVGNIPYFDMDRVCTGTYTCKNSPICILNLYTLLNVTFTSIKMKNYA